MERAKREANREVPPALVFLHGVGGDAACWGPQLTAFGERWRALAWDMPGYGGTAALPAMTFPALAAALAGWLEQRGVAAAHLVGHSMGGMVAQELALSAPERIRSLTLCATSAAFGRAEDGWQKAFLEQRLRPLDQGLAMADLAPSLVRSLIGPDADPAGVAQAIASMAGVPAATYRQAIRCLVTFDRRAALPQIAVPALLIAGERDSVAPPGMMARMAARMRDARLVVIPGAGHLVNLEQPAAFNAALADFLEGHHRHHGSPD